MSRFLLALVTVVLCACQVEVGVNVAVTENGSGTVGVFTHGGVTRAYVAGLLGIPFANRDVFPIPRNTAHCEIIYAADGPRMSSYNVASHLGG